MQCKNRSLPRRIGGHTSEALALLSGLDFDRYCPRKYVVSQGDILSAKKAITLESERASDSAPQHVSLLSELFLLAASLIRQTAAWDPRDLTVS